MARLAALLACAAAVSACGRVWLPQSVERRVGALTSERLSAGMPPVPGHPWASFVESAGGKLAAVSERPDYTYRFTIVSSPDVNAFASPDGHIFITDALIGLAGGDQEVVAAVLGHEVGHVARRHGAEELQSRLGLAAGLTAFFGGNGGLAQAGAQFAAGLAELGYGRDQEMEADLCSIRYLVRLGYPPQTGLKFLRLMAAREAGHPSGFDRYLRSHPPTEERLRYAQAYADSISPPRK